MKQNRGSVLVWVLVVAVLIIVGGGVYYFSTHNTVSLQNQPQNNQNNSTANNTDTSNSKTYTSQSLNITFSYPSDWTLKEGNDYPGSAQGQDYIKITKGSDLIFAGAKTDCLSGYTYCKPVISAEYPYGWPSFSTTSTNPIAKKVIDFIISTAISSNISTSNWKTYTFAALTFKYPPDWSVRTDNDLGGAIITPPSPKDQNDNIILLLKQSHCDSTFKCNWIDASGGAVYDLHTYSTNPITLANYSTILATIKNLDGTTPGIR